VSRHRWTVLALIAALALAAGLAWQADQRRAAAGWLGMARQAPLTVDYHGELQIMVEGGPSELHSRVIADHLAPKRTRYRYVGPDLDGVELLIDGDWARRSDPRTGQQVIRTTDIMAVPMDLSGYRVQIGSGGYVAGRSTIAIKLERDRLIRELWLDETHGLPLRTRTVNPQGTLTDTRFIRVAFEAPPDGVPGTVPTDPGKVSAPLTISDLSQRVGFAIHEPSYVPTGFQLVETRQCACPCGCKGGSAQLIYSDGVGHISLFYTGADCQRCYASAAACSACADHQGALRLDHSAVQVIGHADGQILVVAIGDAGEGELTRMAASVPTERDK